MVSGIPPAAQEKIRCKRRGSSAYTRVSSSRVSCRDALLVRFYQAARVFVVPSLYEGFGLPIVEALACGTPLLAARAPGATELVDPDSDFRSVRRRRPLPPPCANRLSMTVLSSVSAGPRPVRHTWDETAKRTVSAYEGLAHPATESA